MPKIRPMKDLRNTNMISELCHKSGEPIYITKNGYEDSMDAYEKKLAKLDMYEKLAKAEKQLEDGKDLLDAEVVFKGLKKKYGRK